MSKQQVDALLGSPSIADPFHHDRWDYTASQKTGRMGHVEVEHRYAVGQGFARALYLEALDPDRTARQLHVLPRPHAVVGPPFMAGHWSKLVQTKSPIHGASRCCGLSRCSEKPCEQGSWHDLFGAAYPPSTAGLRPRAKEP